MRRISEAAATAAVVIALAACSNDAPPADGGDQAGRSGLAAPAAAPAALPDTTFTVALQPVDGAAGSGTVQFEVDGPRAVIDVTVARAGAGVHHGNVHVGRCAERGGSVERLQSIVADAAGTGNALTVIDLAPAAVLDGNHIVVYEREGAASAALLCAELPALATDAAE